MSYNKKLDSNSTPSIQFFEPDNKSFKVIRIIVVVIAATLIISMAKFTSKPLQKFLDCTSYDRSCQNSKRIQTIMSITVSFVIVIVALVAVGFVLNIIGLKLGSILAGAGIVGLIIGLGAQSVIKDVVTGMLIISENQISEGDYVYITNTSGEVINGTVLELSVRLVKIETQQGSEVFIPSGNILHITNTSRNSQNVMVTVTVPITIDARTIITSLETLADQIYSDPLINNKLLDKPTIVGVNTLSDKDYSVYIQTQVAAGNQWDIGRYIRLQVLQVLQNMQVHAPQVFVNIENNASGMGNINASKSQQTATKPIS